MKPEILTNIAMLFFLFGILAHCQSADDSAVAKNKMCGGIAGFQCEEGFECKSKATYPDASGECVQIRKKTNPDITKTFTPIMKIESVALSRHQSNPPELIILVHGMVNSGGWRNIKLIPYLYIQPPPDGIYDFEMVGTKPGGIVTQAIVEVKAAYKMNYPKAREVKGVRINSRTNRITKLR